MPDILPKGSIPAASTVAAAASSLASWLGTGISEALWPTRCVGCDAPGSLLCDDCTALLPAIEQVHACPHCGAPFGSLVCTECTDCLDRPDGGALEEGAPLAASRHAGAGLDGCACFGLHAWPLDRLIRAYKDWGERRLAPVLARLMLAAVEEASRAGHLDAGAIDAVAFVPAAPKAYARRGFDHMERVARFVAVGLGVPFADILAGCDRRDQRGLDRAARAENVHRSFVPVARLDGASLLLVDDVVTTGATLAQAADACRSAGAIHVWGAAAARAW